MRVAVNGQGERCEWARSEMVSRKEVAAWHASNTRTKLHSVVRVTAHMLAFISTAGTNVFDGKFQMSVCRRIHYEVTLFEFSCLVFKLPSISLKKQSSEVKISCNNGKKRVHV